MLCIVRFARLPASAVRLAAANLLSSPMPAGVFLLRRGGSGPEHARREALPAVGPLTACVMCDIIPTEAKLNRSPPCGLLFALAMHKCNSKRWTWLGLGVSSSFVA